MEIGHSTVSDILCESEKWLNTEVSSSTKKSEGRYQGQTRIARREGHVLLTNINI